MYGDDAGRTHRTARTGLRTGAVALVAMALLTACSGSGGDDTGGDENRRTQQQGADAPFWVNPDGSAAQALDQARADGREDEAALIEKIADQPVGEWIGTDDTSAETRRITAAAEEAGRPALLVLYNIPHRDCDQYSQGGAADGAAYRAWLDQVVEGIGDREAWVVLEPDALAHILVPGCVPQEFHQEQYDVMREAVTKLKALPSTRVYLDAGNPRWVRDAGGMVEPLKRAGVEEADGFSLNVSNYQTTRENVEYGDTLSSMLDGKSFIVDTSRNGNGPVEGMEDEEAWCNPPGRALGEPPTTDTGEKNVDAFVWVKRPGESDGQCKGGPDAGQWFNEYALDLARNAEQS